MNLGFERFQDFKHRTLLAVKLDREKFLSSKLMTPAHQKP
jgi:hypothetical protein